MVPVLCTLLAGVFTFLWVREREGVAPAAGVALLVALSDGVLDYSRWILSDPTFLALTVAGLWALERARGRRTGSAAPTAPREGWVVLGLAFVLMAYFTRSAGIPLVVAALLWLALERQWRAGGAFLAVFGILAALWWWRGRIPGEGAYASEFLLLDPYQPELGRVGVGDMLGRMGENAVAYVTRLIPEGVVGLEGPLLGVLGIGLVLLALVGWLRALWKDRGPAELFLPLSFPCIPAFSSSGLWYGPETGSPCPSSPSSSSTPPRPSSGSWVPGRGPSGRPWPVSPSSSWPCRP